MTDPRGIAMRFGEGRISGVLAVSLGALSLLAVLCFRFPSLLTTADLRAFYPVPLLRAVLFGALLLALAFSALSLLLSRRVSLGLDWFVLDLLLLALVFVPLERAFALLPEQRVLRPAWAETSRTSSRATCWCRSPCC